MACRATLAHPTRLPDSEQQLRQLLLVPCHTRSPTEAQQLSSALAYFRFFQTRSKEVRGQLCRHLEYLAVPAGTVVCKAGTPADLFFLVLSGSLQCSGMGTQVGFEHQTWAGNVSKQHCAASGLDLCRSVHYLLEQYCVRLAPLQTSSSWCCRGACSALHDFLMGV